MTIDTYLADRRALLAGLPNLTTEQIHDGLCVDEELQLAVIEAAARVVAWWAKDPYTQVEKIDGGNDLCAALATLVGEQP